MNQYVKNPACSCSRCRSSRLLFPALVITVGILFLLHANGAVEIDRSWPVLLLVGGLFSFLGASASTEGHVQPGEAMPVNMTMAPAGYPQPGTLPVQNPPAEPTSSTNNDSQVNP
jgi:hypothetical protein